LTSKERLVTALALLTAILGLDRLAEFADWVAGTAPTLLVGRTIFRLVMGFLLAMALSVHRVDRKKQRTPDQAD
tara:strand:- start:550 stop:771 length:222 start_codon:yes stop_codon:yes gene_type:complete